MFDICTFLLQIFEIAIFRIMQLYLVNIQCTQINDLASLTAILFNLCKKKLTLNIQKKSLGHAHKFFRNVLILGIDSYQRN